MRTFSDKYQYVNDGVRRFIRLVCTGMNAIKKGGSLYKYNSNGVLRINDMFIENGTDYLTDSVVGKIFNMTKPEAFKKYGATNDVDLLIKSASVKGAAEDIRLEMHKIFDYNRGARNLMSGVTSITMVNVLASLRSEHKDFSFVSYALPKDTLTVDLWKDAKPNHFIVCSNVYNNTPHWFCMGRFSIKNDAGYFIYCSANNVETILDAHAANLFKYISTLEKGICNIRAPTVQNQKGGNNCGIWSLMIATFIALGNKTGLFDYFVQYISNEDLLRESSKYLIGTKYVR